MPDLSERIRPSIARGWSPAGLNLLLSTKVIVVLFEHILRIKKSSKYLTANLKICWNIVWYVIPTNEFCYTTPMSAVISVRNLVKTYKAKGKSVEAVQNTSFEVNEGEIFGILGPNGAGKTTTLEIIETLKKQTSGQVTVLGKDNIRDVQAIKQLIGVQLQSSDYLPNNTLHELLNLFASFYGRKANTKKLLDFVGLTDKANSLVKDLSGGQKQRFTLASALVNDPKLLILDEPTTGLDPKARRDVWQLIREINAQGSTIVLTTHYMEEAEFLCSRVAVMDGGKILTMNNPHALINDLSHTTQVSFFTLEPIDLQIFAEILPQIEKTYSVFPKVILEIKTLEIVGDIVKILKRENIQFTGFTLRTASLEDVYLDLTGKEFTND